MSIALGCPVCAVAAFYRGPELLGSGKAGAGWRACRKPSQPQWSASLGSVCMDKRKRLQNEKGSSRKCLPLSGSEAPVLVIISRLQEARKTPSAQVEPCCQPASQELEGFWSSVLWRRGMEWIWQSHWSNAAQWWGWWETTLERGGGKLGTSELDGRRSPFLLPAWQFHCFWLLTVWHCDSFS